MYYASLRLSFEGSEVYWCGADTFVPQQTQLSELGEVLTSLAAEGVNGRSNGGGAGHLDTKGKRGDWPLGEDHSKCHKPAAGNPGKGIGICVLFSSTSPPCIPLDVLGVCSAISRMPYIACIVTRGFLVPGLAGCCDMYSTHAAPFHAPTLATVDQLCGISCMTQSSTVKSAMGETWVEH